MSKTTLLIGAVIAALVGAIAAHFFTPAPQVVVQKPPFGAVASPDMPFQYLSVNNFKTWYTSVGLTQNASTTCAIQSPNGTSTLEEAGIRFDTASSSALIVEIGKSAGIDATTTLIGTTYSIAANAQAFIQASTSPSAGANTIFAPNQWLNFKIGGGGTGSLPVGVCQAKFVQY